MNIVGQIAETAGQDFPKSTVRYIYDLLVGQIMAGLKKDRKVRLSGIGILSVRYRPSRPKRTGINPFTKQMHEFKARPASNKLKFRPAKELKQMVERMSAVAPKKKIKK